MPGIDIPLSDCERCDSCSWPLFKRSLACVGKELSSLSLLGDAELPQKNKAAGNYCILKFTFQTQCADECISLLLFRKVLSICLMGWRQLMPLFRHESKLLLSPNVFDDFLAELDLVPLVFRCDVVAMHGRRESALRATVCHCSLMRDDQQLEKRHADMESCSRGAY